MSSATTASAAQANLKLNFNNRDYDISELPQGARRLLQDMMRLDKEIDQLQFELRHLQAAHYLYGTNLRQIMSEEEHSHGPSSGSEPQHGAIDQRHDHAEDSATQ